MRGHRLTASVMAGLLLCLLLTACAAEQTKDSRAGEGEQKILNVWHQWGSGNKSEKFIQEAADHYEKAHPDIKIKLHALSTKTYTTKISMDFVGTAEDVDVFYYQVPSLMSQLVRADQLLPLNDYLSPKVLAKIKEGRLRDTTVGGKIYGLPLYSSVFVLYCNRALFRQCQAELPATGEQLLDVGRELLKQGITPLAVGAQDSWLAGGLYESIAVTGVGADRMRAVAAGELSMKEIPEFRTAAEQMNTLFEEGFLGELPLNMTEYDAMEAFFDGRAAMLLDGTWASEYIDNSGMDPEEIEVIGFPPYAGSRFAGNYVGSMTSGSFFVNKNTDLPEEAADFAIYLTEYLGTRVYESGSGLACWDAERTSLSPTLKKVIALWDGADNYVSAWDTILPKESAQLHLRECQELLSPEADLEGFLAVHDEILMK